MLIELRLDNAIVSGQAEYQAALEEQADLEQRYAEARLEAERGSIVNFTILPSSSNGEVLGALYKFGGDVTLNAAPQAAVNSTVTGLEATAEIAVEFVSDPLDYAANAGAGASNALFDTEYAMRDINWDVDFVGLVPDLAYAERFDGMSADLENAMGIVLSAVGPKLLPLKTPRVNVAQAGGAGQRTLIAAERALGAPASSAAQGARLGNHLRQWEKYGTQGFKELESGRFRYYGDVAPANRAGDMVGRRLVREWDPATGATRTWHETLDAAGTIRQVRPVIDGAKVHYRFDANGNYIGRW